MSTLFLKFLVLCVRKCTFLNFTNPQFTNFTTKNNNQIEITIIYNNNKSIPTDTCTKFLGLIVDCSLTWLNHIDLVTKN